MTIVPFGKYKGQQVEALANDRAYVEWLTAQPWFRDKFTNIYNVVVQNSGEPTETPEHNELQTLFLDDEFCFRFLAHLADWQHRGATLRRQFEYQYRPGYPQIDVHLEAETATNYYRVDIEIKPRIGDDYPAVLRQMRANRADCLFTREYHGVGATREQFVQIFAMSGFRVVFLEDIAGNTIAHYDVFNLK